MANNKDTEKQPLTHGQSGGRRQAFFLRHIVSISRLCGIVVLAVMWAATVTSLEGKVSAPKYVPYYLLAASIVVTFFEFTWVLDKLACCVRQGCCCRCWSVILWVDGWRKFIFYTAISVPLFLQGLEGVINLVGGFCLLVLACLYLVKSFSSISTGRDGHEPIPESKPVPVTCHEISTQTDAISASAEKQTTDVSTNPFETEGVSDTERTDHPETDQTDTKTIDETADKSGKDKTADP